MLRMPLAIQRKVVKRTKMTNQVGFFINDKDKQVSDYIKYKKLVTVTRDYNNTSL